MGLSTDALKLFFEDSGKDFRLSSLSSDKSSSSLSKFLNSASKGVSLNHVVFMTGDSQN